MTLKMDDKETRAFLTILNSQLNDIVSVVKKCGYDKSAFFVDGDARGLDFRGSDIRGVSFRNTDLRGCKFYDDQHKMVEDSKPRDMSGIQLFDRGSVDGELNYKEIIGKAKNLMAARRALGDATAAGVPIDDDLLASTLSKAKNFDEAKRAQLELDPNSEISGEQTYNTLISKYKKKGGQLDLLKEMRERSISPSTETYLRLIGSLKYSDGIELLLTMDKESVNVNQDILATLAAKAPTPKAARSMFDEALSRSIQIKSHLVNAVMAKATTFADALEVLVIAKQNGFDAQTKNYNTLLKMAPSFSDTLPVLDEMISLNLAKDSETFRILIRKATSLEEAIAVAEEAELFETVLSTDVRSEIDEKLILLGKTD